MSLTMVRVSATLPLAAEFSSPQWKNAASVTAFTDTTTRKAALLPTTAHVLYDGKNLYVGFDCGQSGSPISDSRNIQNLLGGVDDYVAVSIDPTGTGARSYTFEATPNGLKYQISSEATTYFPYWTAIGHRGTDRYSVLMVIPFNILRAESGEQSWRINFQRHIAAANEDYTWAYEAQSASYQDPTTWPTVADLHLSPSATRPPGHAAVYALGAAGIDRKQFQDNNGIFTALPNRNLGIDVSVPFTNTTSLVATLNPDFSNIERDETTISPQQFRRNLSEYRPFFAQGAQFITPVPAVPLLTSPDTPFYSRSIGAFDRGIKIEGTQGRNAFGVLEARGAGFDDEAYGYQYSTPDNTMALSLEGIAAHHTSLNDQTFGFGASRKNVHSGEVTNLSFLSESGTTVADPSQAKDFALTEGVITDRLTALVGYKAVGAQYQPIDGYTAYNDVKGPEGVLSYSGAGSENSRVKQYSLAVLGDRFRNQQGDISVVDSLATVSVTSKDLVSLSLSDQASGQRFYGNPYPFYGQPLDVRFNQATAALGYRDGTATPTDVSYSFGPYGVACAGLGVASAVCDGNTTAIFVPSLVQQTSLSTSVQLAQAYAVSLQYQGVEERGGPLSRVDSQWLRGIAISRGIGLDSSISLQLRSISGNGGFSAPGLNLSGAVHLRFRNLSELYVNFGSPASSATLNRFLVKYTLNLGSGTGV